MEIIQIRQNSWLKWSKKPISQELEDNLRKMSPEYLLNLYHGIYEILLSKGVYLLKREKTL
jgi:hypothetical protein